MNIHLELAKMVCMGWKPAQPGDVLFLLRRHRDGTPSLHPAEMLMLLEAIEKLAPKSVQPNVSVDQETKAIGSTVTVKRRGCPPGGWPKKDKPPERASEFVVKVRPGHD